MSPPAEASRATHPLHDAAVLFNVAASPRRLELLERLASGGGTLSELATRLGGEKRALNAHLQTLLNASLVSSRRGDGEKVFELTDAGTRLLRTARELGGEAREEPEDEGPAGMGLDQLTTLVKAFGDPVRLRLLNVLCSAGEVCVCHLHEVLELPQSTISRHLAQLRAAGLIAGRRKGTWVYYRLARPAKDVREVLLNHVAADSVRGEEFRADAARAKAAGGCSKGSSE